MNYPDDYLSYLTLEKGLAPSTIEAYTHSLKIFTEFLAQHNGGTDIIEVSIDDVSAFIVSLTDHKLSEPTRRRTLSAIRGLYKYLTLEGHRSGALPTKGLASPKRTRALPKIMSEHDIDKLLAAPDTDTPRGQRDFAMVQVLYATGLRVSELVNMTLKNIHLNEGFVRIWGKGGKERIAPLGDQARDALNKFISDGRKRWLKALSANRASIL